MNTLWYVVGLVAMFYFGFAIASVLCMSRRMDDEDARREQSEDEPCTRPPT